MNNIPTGKIVRNKKSGAIGFTISDVYGCCLPNEVLVNYEGSHVGNGTEVENLEIIHPDIPEPDPDKCGLGRGEECCIFLTAGSNGFRCERFTSNRRGITLKKKEMAAQRHPVEMYPDCRIF